MALLDRLRPQPGWKHPDPATRAAAVEGLPDSEQTLLASLAREDASARVRRAAVNRLDDIGALETVARSDADAQVRSDASARLLTMATESDDEPRRQAAAAALADERQLVQLAKTARHLDVALVALARVREPRALGGIARHALHEDVRLRALERVDDPAELEAIAVNTEHRDSGLAAVDRLADPRVLDGVAERARNKMVAKRARSIVRDHQAREAEIRTAVDARARRHSQIVEAFELLTRARDSERGRAELGRLRADWDAAGPASDEAQARYSAAYRRADDHLSAIDREAQAAAAARAAYDAAISDRRALIARASALDGPDAADGVPPLAEAWAQLAPWAHADAAALARDFQAACDRAHQLTASREQAAARRGDLEAVAAEAMHVVEEADLGAARARWSEVSGRWRALAEGLAVERELYDRFRDAEARWKAREAAAREQSTREGSTNLARLTSLCDRAAALARTPDALLKDLEHAVRDLRAASDHLGPLPTPDMQETMAARVRSMLGSLSPRLRELRDTDDWRRWANAGIQEELCKRVEALQQVTDPQEAGRQLRDLRRQWKAVSAGPRDDGNALWDRFRNAADQVQVRCDAHTARLASEHAQHLAARQAICDRAEALAESTDWIATAETLKQLQADWHATGPSSKDQGAELVRRFRAACDRFFTRRKTDLTERKQVWAVNAQKKEGLCARAEALATSVEWATAVTEIKQLQAEWKLVGPVRKNRSEALWKRFRAACDAFFERYGKRHEIEHAHRLQDREAACQSLEGLASPDPAADPLTTEKLLASLEGIYTRWHEAPGLPPEQMQPLRARFDAALGQVMTVQRELLRGSRFDLGAARERRAALCTEVEDVLDGAAGAPELASSSAATLAARLKESLAANTIGGRANEGNKTRASAEQVRRAQAAWRELGPVMGDEGRALEHRFQKACRRFFDLHPEHRHQPGHAPHGGGPPRDRGGRPQRAGNTRRE